MAAEKNDRFRKPYIRHLRRGYKQTPLKIAGLRPALAVRVHWNGGGKEQAVKEQEMSKPSHGTGRPSNRDDRLLVAAGGTGHPGAKGLAGLVEILVIAGLFRQEQVVVGIMDPVRLFPVADFQEDSVF